MANNPHHMIGNENGKYRVTRKKAHSGSDREPDRTDARADDSVTDKGAIPSAGIRAGEIIAWRAWRLISRGAHQGKLLSMVVPFIWEPGKINKSGGTIPLPQDMPDMFGWFLLSNGDNDTYTFSADGFYAFKTIDQARAEYNYVADFYNYYLPTVFGTVELWGQVVEYDRGYRAEYAKVKSVHLIQSIGDVLHDALIEELNQTYTR